MSNADPKPVRFATPLVYLVGAGPGDPGLLTLRGAEVLAMADVVLYDGLSNPAVLQHAPTAEHISVGKHGHSRIWQQDEINTEILKHAMAGRCVVRLKGGDPAVFARTAEEIDVIRKAGLGFEVVPGITAALAAGSYAGIPITHRGFASAVALVTGHEEPGKSETALDWPALARFPGTLVVYMGVTTAGVWTAALMAGGKPADTPAAIVRRCSLPDQQVLTCRLDEVTGHLTPASKMRPPVIVIIGPVANLASQGSWFAERPLSGQRILITRAEGQCEGLARPLRDMGAEVLQQPAIQIGPAENQKSLIDAINNIAEFDWLLLTSRNAVDYFFRAMTDLGYDSRRLAPVKIATVGKKTNESLSRHGLKSDFVSETSSAEGLIRFFQEQPAGLSLLWPAASRSTQSLVSQLETYHHISSIIAYEHRDVTVAIAVIAERLKAGEIHWTTITSSAIATSVVNLFGEDLKHTKLVSLSPKISDVVRSLGYEVSAEAKQPSMASLIEVMQIGPR